MAAKDKGTYDYAKVIPSFVVEAVKEKPDPAKLTSMGQKATGLCSQLHEPLSSLAMMCAQLARGGVGANPIIVEMADALVRGDEAELADLWRRYEWSNPAEKQKAWNFGIPACRAVVERIKRGESGDGLAEFEYLVIGKTAEGWLKCISKNAEGTFDRPDPAPMKERGEIWCLSIGPWLFRGLSRANSILRGQNIEDYLKNNPVPRTVTIVGAKPDDPRMYSAAKEGVGASPALPPHKYRVVEIVDKTVDGSAIKTLKVGPNVLAEEFVREGFTPPAATPVWGIKIGSRHFAGKDIGDDECVSAVGLTKFLEDFGEPRIVEFICMQEPAVDENQYRGQGVRRDSEAG